MNKGKNSGHNLYQKKNEMLEQIFNNSEDYEIICDEKFNIIFLNNKALKLLNAAEGINIFCLFQNAKERELKKNLKNDKSILFTDQLKYNGNEFFVRVKIFKIIEEDCYYIFIIRDISEEIKVKHELKIEKMFMYNIMNQLPDAIYIKDKESKFLRINKTQIETLGVKEESEAIGKSDKDFFTEEHANDAFNDEQRLINKEIPFVKKEELIRHSSKKLRWVSTIKAPLLDEDKNIIGTLGITRDITDKKEIEAALIKSELLFKSIWNNSIDGMRILDQNGKIFMVNPAFCSMFELSEKELIGKPISVLFNKNLPQIKNKKIREKELNKLKEDIRRKNIPYRFESKINLWNNKSLWFEITNSFFVLENEIFLLSVFRDITERKTVEAELAYSENLNKTTIDALSDMLFVVDKNLNIVLLNSSLSNFLKKANILYDKSNFSLSNLIKLFPFLKTDYYEVVTQTKKEIIIFESYTLNEVYYYFEVKLFPVIDKNSVIRIITLILDITDLKKYEEELRRTALIFENLNDSVIIFSSKGKIVDLNYSTEKLLGLSKKQLINNDFSILAKYGLVIPEIDELKKILSESKKWNNKIWFYNEKLINKKHIDIEILPLTDEKGENFAYFAISRDITDLTNATNKLNIYIGELQKKTQMLEKSEKELKSLNDSKDKFFSIIAHDLKSPFQSILGFYNILKEDFDSLSKEEIEYIIKNMGEGTKNLYALIENLLEWSRVQLGKIDLVKENFNLSELIKSVINLLKGNAIKKYIKIETTFEDNIFVYADIKMINSVLTNLLSNSLKFTNKGGRIIISAIEEKRQVKITLEDTGIGMDKKTLADLFRIDKNISRRGTENEKGTGLGLLLCKEFIERNNGKLKVKSKVNLGTTFIFTLPNAKNV
jgi:PAS domain S-box-containing protein